MLTNSELKPIFKFASNLNTVEQISESSRARAHGEKILEAVYTLLNGQVANSDYELSAEDIKIINARRKAVLKGSEKTYTVAQVKKKLLKNLGK